MDQGTGCVSRRTVMGAAIAGVAVAGLTGCGGTDWYPSDVTPDEYVLRSLIREKERMVVRYERALAESDGPVELWERLLENHVAHMNALIDALPEGTEVSPEPEEGEPEPVPVSEDPTLTEPLSLAALRTLESSAASTRPDRAATVTDPGLAQLISAIGACEAGHAHLLDDA